LPPPSQHKAAPPFALFEGWVPQTTTSISLFMDDISIALKGRGFQPRRPTAKIELRAG